MKPTSILAAFGVTIALASPLKASESADRPHSSRSILYKTLDADEDGTLSSGEIDGSTAALRTLDGNSDGRLTRNEMMTPPPVPPSGETGEEAGTQATNEAAEDTEARPQEEEQESPPKPHRPGPSPLMVALDLDHDGILSSDELEEAPESLRRLDDNGDGEVNLDDFRPARPLDQPAGNDRPQGPPPHGRRPLPPGEPDQQS